MKMSITTSLKLSLFMSFIALIQGCSSPPVSINYYALNTINKENIKPAENNKEQQLILLSPIKLADFLTTGALVTQIKTHQIHLSKQHLWADNLADAIARNLLVKLTANVPKYHFELSTVRWNNSVLAHIEITLDQFTVTDKGETISAGTFWLLDNEDKLLNKESFEIHRPLTQDGYDHAVAQLDLSLTTLVEQISEKLEM